GGISKRGNQYLRRLLINGASANLLRSKATNADPWVIGLRRRRPRLVVAVALANKTARIAWAVMQRHENYQRVAAAAEAAEPRSGACERAMTRDGTVGRFRRNREKPAASSGHRSRSNDEDSVRGPHQGQQSTRTAPTGRTHDCKRPLRCTPNDLLPGAGHPHAKRREFITLLGGAGAALFAVELPCAALAQDGADWVPAFPRAPVHVAAWPAGRKVAVSFALFVEEFGFGQGPVFRPDLA